MNGNLTPGYMTTEFWTAIASKVAGFVFVLVLIGLLPAGDQQEMTKVIAEIVLGVGALVVNGAVLWRYIASRQALKEEAMKVSGSGEMPLPPPV